MEINIKTRWSVGQSPWTFDRGSYSPYRARIEAIEVGGWEPKFVYRCSYDYMDRKVYFTKKEDELFVSKLDAVKAMHHL